MHDDQGVPGQLAGALSDQRVSRKRAQEDVKLLANRIALLKQEEQKVTVWFEPNPPLGLEKNRRDKEEGKRHHKRETAQRRQHELQTTITTAASAGRARANA